MSTAIELRDVRFSYSKKPVLQGIDLTVDAGEVVCLLGPNGVGKTTIIENIIGSLTPDSGTVRALGTDPRKAGAEYWSKLGLVQQNWSDHPKWRVIDQLNWIHSIHRTTGTQPMLADAALAAVGLEDKATLRMSKLSGGQRRSVDFAAALIGTPELLILDEPTTGLDPVSKARIHDLIMDRADSAATVLMTTHDLAEAEKLASRIVIMSQGRIIADGSPAQLRDRFATTAEVTWTQDGQAFVHSTDTPEAFLQTLDLDAVSNLSVTRATLEDTYLAIVNTHSQHEGDPHVHA